jgi:bacterial/archaeal transporter family-2 protein
MTDLVERIGLIFVCVTLGVFLTWQAPVNAEAARRLGSPALAALYSIGTSTLLVFIFAIIVVKELPKIDLIHEAPWWTWIGGITGAVFVAGALLIVPRTGSVVFLVSVIAGQLIGAITADRFGMWGLQAITISPLKWLALSLVISGAVTFHLSD